MLIRFRKRLTSKQHPIQPNELLQFTEELILFLEQEVKLGNLTPTEYRDYIKLINYAAERVFIQTPQYQEEVFQMTKSQLQLPSDEIDELKFTIL